VFEGFSGNTVEELARACTPALRNLIDEEDFLAKHPLFAGLEDEKEPEHDGLIDEQMLNELPDRYNTAVKQAVQLFRFLENKDGISFAPVFAALLGSVDEAAKGLMVRRLQPDLPKARQSQDAWFDVYLANVDRRTANRYTKMANNLKKTLVFSNGLFPLGLLRQCLEYSLNDKTKLTGVFDSLRAKFKVKGGRDLLSQVKKINDFRNNYVAHQEQELTDAKLAEEHLKVWIKGLHIINKAN